MEKAAKAPPATVFYLLFACVLETRADGDSCPRFEPSAPSCFSLLSISFSPSIITVALSNAFITHNRNKVPRRFPDGSASVVISARVGTTRQTHIPLITADVGK